MCTIRRQLPARSGFERAYDRQSPIRYACASEEYYCATLHQTIRFTRSVDEVRLAYAESGTGPPLVKAANWLSHLEFDWQSPVWRHWFGFFSSAHRLIRYDARGCGLSDWDVADLTLAAQVADLEAVVEAAHVDRFALIGISQGGAVAVEYSIRHPERVSHLVLYGAFARGWKHRGEQAARAVSRAQRARASRMGPGEPGVPQAVRDHVRAGCERRAGTLVQRSHARHVRAGNRRADYRGHWGHRCRGQTSRRYGSYAGHPRPG